MVEAVNAAASSSNSALQSLGGNYTMFLKLLTTQLQNQDPLSPTDSTTFTQQLVQYSQVEQQIKTNDNLSTLVDTTKTANNSNLALLNYIGRYAEVSGKEFALQGSTATMTYQLASAAQSVKLEILDSSGAKVASYDGPAGGGLQKITWDGKTNSGVQLSDGKYSLNIVATGTDGKSITVSQQSSIGKVTGVERSASGNRLSIGKFEVEEANVTNVYNSPSDKA